MVASGNTTFCVAREEAGSAGAGVCTAISNVHLEIKKTINIKGANIFFINNPFRISVYNDVKPAGVPARVDDDINEHTGGEGFKNKQGQPLAPSLFQLPFTNY